MPVKIVFNLLLLTFSLQAQAQFWTHRPFDKKPAIKLPGMGIDRNAITVSGLSSGAFMAVQLGVSFSSVFHGVGVVAGGIYNCAEGDPKIAQNLCMKDPAKIDEDKYVKDVVDKFKNKIVDDPLNIKNQTIFILAGTEDKTILPEASHKLESFYKKLGAKPITEYSLKMGHAFPSPLGSNSCEISKFPWINNCNYDGAQNILESFYGKLNDPAQKSLENNLIAYDQKEFGSRDAFMLDFGYVYIPKSCRQKNSKCGLHVALHGCLQDPSIATTDFAEKTGFNEWAETNNLVILYPAVKIGVSNPNGCWDWFGYTGPDYATRSGKQLVVIMQSIARLLDSNPQVKRNTNN